MGIPDIQKTVEIAQATTWAIFSFVLKCIFDIITLLQLLYWNRKKNKIDTNSTSKSNPLFSLNRIIF